MRHKAVALLVLALLAAPLAVGTQPGTSAGSPSSPDYFVIFIPGILGSKLSDPVSGSVLWGDGKSSVQMLALKPNDGEATPQLLDRFPTWITWQDVYGTFDTEVIALVGTRERFVEFPYDWRQDINVTTRRFNEKIQGEWRDRLKGQRLVLIAHSMGGLIAWNWKNKYYRRGGYDFEWSRLLLLGTPLDGSCEALRMLLDGYRPAPPDIAGPRIGKLEDLGYRLLFDSLRATALTFPSVFQLLPKVGSLDRRTSCLIIEPRSDEYEAVDHFQSDIWITFLFPLLDGWRSWVRRLTPRFVERWARVRPVWEELDISKDEFANRLKKLLLEARSFRETFDPSEDPLRGRVEYLFSDRHSTTTQVQVRMSGVHPWEGVMLRGGDGRVTQESATNSHWYTSTPTPLGNNHGDLVRDELFFGFLRKELRRSR